MKGKLLILTLMLAVVFGTAGFMALSYTRYLEVSEVLQYEGPAKVSVMGNVTAGSVHYKGGKTVFLLTDGRNYVKVIYNGIFMLDNSTNYARINVRGIYYPDKKVIVANEIYGKCPSKKEVEALNKKS